jgi:hypothetical protein
MKGILCDEQLTENLRMLELMNKRRKKLDLLVMKVFLTAQTGCLWACWVEMLGLLDWAR